MRRSVSLLVVLGTLSPLAHAQGDPTVTSLYRESYQLEAQRDLAGALSKMREIRRLAGPSYFVALRTGWLAYLAGDLDSAVAAYREAIAAEPKAIEPVLGLTLPLLAQRNWRALERACRKVLRRDPQNALARARLAHALYWSGNYPDAAAVYRKLVASYPGDLDHKTGLAWALKRMGRGDEARRLFDAVLAVSPDNPHARQGITAP
jgi:tetratricopeptide (TPR) repeat protein